MPSDFLLELDGIKGESQDSKHKESIEILSFSWGASNAGGFGSGGGGGVGKVSFQDLSMMKLVDKSSPLLLMKCATGDHIDKGVLFVRKAGKDQQEFYTITLEHIFVTSFQVSASNGGGLPTESFSLNFEKIKWEYKPQDAKGGLGSAVPFTYSVAENTTG